MARLTKAQLGIFVLLFVVGCSEAKVADGGDPERSGGNGRSGASTGSNSGDRGGDLTAVPQPNAMPTAPDAGTAQCAAESHAAQIVPLDLMLLVDSSGSMEDQAGMSTKWEIIQATLRSFVSDPKSAGLGVGLQFFPLEKPCMTDVDCSANATSNGRYCVGQKVCADPNGPTAPLRTCSGNSVGFGNFGGGACPAGATCQQAGVCSGSGNVCTNLGQACAMDGGTCQPGPKTCNIGPDNHCEPTRYETPAVPIGPLPAAQLALTQGLNLKGPNGGTPMGAAVRAVLNHMRAHLMANPGHKIALVLASDGLPSGCGDVPSIAADLAAAFAGPPSIPTYVIGVFNPMDVADAQAKLDQLAMAGGTATAFVLTATDELNIRLLEALNQIRGAALACDYQIPAPQKGSLDFGKVNVRYTATSGSQEIPYVEQMDRCDPMRGGWYYDVPPASGTPARVVVCPATCRQFQSDQSAKVELLFGCATRTID